MRYAQIQRFKPIGEKGHKVLESKTVTVAGLGNVGSTSAVMLLRSGVSLRVVDKGRCEPGDLDCQSIYLEEDSTKFKAKQAKKRLETINPRVKVRTFHEDLGKNNTYLLDADLVIDATGNHEASRLISEYCRKKKIPHILALVTGSQGLVATSETGIDVSKLSGHISKMRPIKETGLINPAVHQASALIVTNALKMLLRQKVAKECVTFDAWTGAVKRSKV